MTAWIGKRHVETTAETYSVKRKGAAPISGHPAFPAIVALWFAALLGFGSLVLPIALLERIVTLTGIASLIPSAEPPLGLDARLAIALGAAIVGTALGLLLARRVARAHVPEPQARRWHGGGEEPVRPILAHDELGNDDVDAPVEPGIVLAPKRRSLTIAEENARSTYLEAVPLPGQPAGSFVELPALEPEPAEATPLELAEFADTSFEDDEDAALGEPDPVLEALRSRIHGPAEQQDHPMTEQADEYADETFAAAADPRDPLPFTAPSLRRAEPAFDEDEFDDTDLPELPAQQSLPDQFVPQLSVIESDPVEPVADDRPLDELGLVQLAARLGASLQKRRASMAARAEISPPVVATEEFEAAQPEDAARAIADFFGPAITNQPPHDLADQASVTAEAEDEAEAEAETEMAPAVPAHLQGLSFDADEEADDEFAGSLSLPTRNLAKPVAEGDASPDAASEEDDEEGEYSSLLAMKNPFVRQQEFVRVEEPEDEAELIEPTVTFPSPSALSQPVPAEASPVAFVRPFDPPRKPANSAAPATADAALRDPGDTERSLRDALATLQRMSGAA